MNMLMISLFTGFGLFYLILGLLVSRGIKTTQDYFLAGRKLGLFYLTFTLVATQIGGGTLLGTSAQSYKIGYFGIFYTLGIALGFLFLGLGIASKLRAFNVSTTAQLFQVKYGSISLKKLASILSVLTMFGIVGGQVVALRGMLFSLGMNSEFVFIAFWLFIVIYTVVGGLKAVTVTDAFQVLFIIILFTGLFIYSLLAEPASFFNVKSLIGKQKLFMEDGLSFLALFPVIFNPMMFSFIEQDLAQRFFAAKSKKTAATAALLASLSMILFSLIPIYFGMKARLGGIPFSESPLISILSTMVGNLLLSFIICGLAAAIISTSDSLLCAISSNICQDFDFTYLGFKDRLKVSKSITFLVGMAALFVAYFTSDIIGIIVQSYELSISCLLVPIFFCYFKKNLHKQAALFSIILGVVGFVLFRIYPLPFPKELATLILSFIGYLIGDSFEF